ncbi:MAG TPA: Hsp70 family protein [Pseudonocardia sp.]|uniref:Hsp70 family protein n=1 Tax=Pseudonocardia sp. TaxID=60912 RepID=UPI002CA497D9|nr:Hsp70 family protein [Pseudonocardia sp.]HTF51021.1 Hsp70 family protein [Pseudonocardia sp.]
MAYNLGVDLGTTFVAAAVAHPTQVEMFTLGDRSVVAPAVVYLRDDGELVTGDAAGRRAVSSPDRVGREFKRRLGDPTPVMLGGEPHAVTGLLGSLLRDVIRKVTETEGVPPERVVLTHPANWGPFRRGLFEEVPNLAGLSDVTLVTEPEAAAAHYAASRELDDGEIVAVYDLGGGTFDATVLCKRANGVEILGTPEGIERLGGVDFDEAILSHVNFTAGGSLSELDMRDPQTTIALARLREECILAKETLSADTETVLPVFLPGRHFDVRLTRAEFEDMVRAPIESTIGALSRTLRSAGVSPDQLTAVLLVGGSSRIPLVARMVSEEMGRPTVVDTHPKYAVALGAATLAGIPSGAAVRASRGTYGSNGSNGSNGHSTRIGHLPGADGDEPAWGVSGVDVAPVRQEPRVPELPRAGAPPPTTALAAPAVESPPRAPIDPPTAAIPTQISGAPPAPQTGGWAPPGYAGPGPGRPPGPPPRGGPPRGAPPGGRPPPGPGRGYEQRGPSPEPQHERPGVPKWQLVALGMLALAAALAVVFGTVFVINAFRATPPEEDATSVSNPAALAPPPAAQTVVASVPIPSLDAPIAIGATPKFAAVSPNGRLVYVANGDAKIVTVMDTSINRVIATIPVDAGPPQFLTFAPDGRRIYISIFDQARTIAIVGVLDTTTNKVVATIPVRTRPFRSAVTRDGRLLYVPNHDSGTLSVVDTASLKVVKEIKVAPNPHWIEFNKDGTKAYMANHESNVVSVLDLKNDTVIAQIPVGTSPHALSVHPTKPLLANVNYDSQTVTMIDTNTNKVIATIPVGKNPQSIGWSPDGRFVYAVNNTDSSVTVINGETNQPTATIPTGPSPTSVAVLPDGRHAYVTNLNSGTLTVLNPGG